eukprot:2128932-Pleurochrysis_carterae.AAC.1
MGLASIACILAALQRRFPCLVVCVSDVGGQADLAHRLHAALALAQAAPARAGACTRAPKRHTHSGGIAPTRPRQGNSLAARNCNGLRKQPQNTVSISVCDSRPRDV